MAKPERKYVLTRVAAGDWILPSNDGQTIWRIRTYEDGPSHGLEDWARDKTFWGIWRWRGQMREGGAVDPDDWSQWEFTEGMMNTRGEAVDRALGLR